jgi:hypothetical protein
VDKGVAVGLDEVAMFGAALKASLQSFFAAWHEIQAWDARSSLETMGDPSI